VIRQPAVANRFYPGNPKELERTVRSLLPPESGEKTKALGVVSPHAGYIYSGAMAGRTIGSIQVPRTVVILGPKHHAQGARAAVSTASWKMPGGIVPCAAEIADKLLARSTLLAADESAHAYEHSLEVQVPFLQALQPDLQIVPIALSGIQYDECVEIADALSAVIAESGQPILLLASSDMSHYESRAAATEKDQQALDQILAMDPEGLYRTVLTRRISMCGFIPVTITLKAAMNLGAERAELVGYTDSGAVSGDTDQVVGYAGVVIS